MYGDNDTSLIINNMNYDRLREVLDYSYYVPIIHNPARPTTDFRWHSGTRGPRFNDLYRRFIASSLALGTICASREIIFLFKLYRENVKILFPSHSAHNYVMRRARIVELNE